MGRYSESFLLQTSLRICPFKIKIPVSSLFLLSLLNISWMFTNSWTVNWVSWSQRHILTPARYTIWLEKKISLHWQMFLSPILLFPFFGTMQLLSLWALIWHIFLFLFLMAEEEMGNLREISGHYIRLGIGIIPLLLQHLTTHLFLFKFVNNIGSSRF